MEDSDTPVRGLDMRKTTLSLLSILFLFAIIAARPGAHQAPAEDLTINIQVSPSTILLVWNTQGDPRITVHAEINLGTVSRVDVRLDGIEPLTTFADSRGDLVAKFAYEDLKALLDDSELTEMEVELTLTGTLLDGTPFSGSDRVKVKG
jgi:hypothetical protein